MRLTPINVFTTAMHVTLHGSSNFHAIVISFGMNDQGCAVPILLSGSGSLLTGMALVDERDGRTYDLATGNVYEDEEDFHAATLDYETGNPLGAATKPGPGRPPKPKLELDGSGPWGIVFNGKAYAKNSHWQFSSGDYTFVFTTPGGEKSPASDPRITKVTRDHMMNEKRAGTDEFHYKVVIGETPKTPSVEELVEQLSGEEEEDDFEDLV
jgi:hypothetical protein